MMEMISRRQSLLGCLLLGMCAVHGPGLAQDQSGANAAGILEEVVVTAQRRAQSIQQVPISISAFEGSQLEDAGAATIEEVARRAPGFQVATGAHPTNNIMFVRGIGSVGNSAIESSVGVFIDGVYYPRAGSVIGQLVDVERFEVLRGPQGTLFGRNTPMGALNITTRNPDRESGAQLEAGYGYRDALELGGFLNGSLGDSLAGRLAFRYVDRDGYGINLLDNRHFGARQDLVSRGKLAFDLSGDMSLLVAVDYARIRSGGMAVEVLNSTANPAFDAGLVSLYGTTATTADPHDWTINQDHRDRLRDEQGGVALDFHYGMPAGIQLRSISAYRHWQARSIESALRLPGDVLPRVTRFDTTTISQEVQLLSALGDSIDWVAGLFWYREHYDIDQGFHAGGDFCVPTVEALVGPGQAQDCLTYPQQQIVASTFRQNLDSIAGFGQLTWHIGDAVASTLGLRWTRDRKSGEFIQVLNNPYANLFRVAENDPGMRRNDSDLTGFANVSWFPAPDLMVFATGSSGYKSGGFNPEGAAENLGSERRTFGPESAINFELGVKGTLLAGRMTANVTAYRTDLEDFQDRAFDGLSFRVLNVGKVRQQGIEADVRWRPVNQLHIMSGVGYLHSRYLSFPNAPPLPGDSAPQDLSGERKTNSPRWQLALDAEWSRPLRSGVQWFVGSGWQYVDDQNVGLISNNNPQSVQEAYALVNARVGLRAAADRWNVTLFGNNLAGQGYCLSMGDQPLANALGAVDAANHAGVQRCIAGAPRTWNARVRWRF